MQDNDDFEQFVFGNEFETNKKPQMEGKDMKDERTDKSKPLPKDKIQCTKCKDVFAQRPDVREKRIESFGSANKLEDNYLCRECRKGKTFNGRDWVITEKKAKPEKKAKAKKK